LGAAGYSDSKKSNKYEARKERYIKRHAKNGDWGKINRSNTKSI
jgi:hypothetical protein